MRCKYEELAKWEIRVLDAEGNSLYKGLSERETYSIGSLHMAFQLTGGP